jgi:hypothetical protein
MVLLSKNGARLLSAACLIMLFTLLALSGIEPTANSAESGFRTTYLKLVFDAEGKQELTSGCFNVQEKRYEDARWWSTPGGTDRRDVEHLLKKVVAALRNRDRASLLQMSDPASRAPKVFDRQAEAFFQQFGVLTVKEIPRSIQINSLILFFLTFDHQGKVFSAPLVFRKAGENEFWFLPEGSMSLDYLLVSEWFDTLSASADKVDSYHCTSAEIARASYRVPISSGPAVAAKDRSYLYLAGSQLGKIFPPTELATRIESTLSNLKASLMAYDGAAPLPTFGPLGAKRLKDWWATADASERSNYISAVVTQEPFFVFDLSPLIVLYTKSHHNIPRIMYFTPDGKGSLRWTNSSYGTTLDRIFKNGPLYDAAKLAPPFSSVLIRR